MFDNFDSVETFFKSDDVLFLTFLSDVVISRRFLSDVVTLFMRRCDAFYATE